MLDITLLAPELNQNPVFVAWIVNTIDVIGGVHEADDAYSVWSI